MNIVSYPLELEVDFGAGTTISVYLSDGNWKTARYLLACYLFWLFCLQQVDVEKWVCVSMDVQRNYPELCYQKIYKEAILISICS